jgi:hypothetical protein
MACTLQTLQTIHVAVVASLAPPKRRGGPRDPQRATGTTPTCPGTIGFPCATAAAENRGVNPVTASSPLWAQSNSSTLDELRRPDAVTLICGDRQPSCTLLRQLGDAASATPASVTDLALVRSPVESANELFVRLSDHALLFDLETLCWSPWLRLDPLRLLRQLARRNGVIAVWPGDVTSRTASFSAPGRRDHVSVFAGGISVMRPIPTRFPDEAPFTIERIPT